MNKIVTLLELQKQIREAKTIKDIGFLAANRTHDLIAYKQAVFWIKNPYGIELKTLSGSATLDDNSPYAIWLKKIIIDKIGDDNSPTVFIEADDKDGEWVASHNHLISFKTNHEGVLGGLWVESDMFFCDCQVELMHELSDCFAQSLALLRARESRLSLFGFLKFGGYRKWIMMACLALFFLPVRLSMTAPAEIVPDNPTTITMPFDGVIDDIPVNAGDKVQANDVLATMDEIQLKTEMDRADNALRAAQKSLSRAGMESLRSEDKKLELQKLRSDIDLKRVDYNFMREKFDQTTITTPVNGVAIYSDKSALTGRPLQTGETIMMIADPAQVELLVNVPVHSFLPVNKGQAVSFYLNNSPLSYRSATITSIGYQASNGADGLMTYKIRATMDDQNDIRIGWKGTAKIKTDWTILGYALLRRPLIALRNITGI